VKIELIQDVSRIREISPDWTALLENSTANDIFLTPDWILSWIKIFLKSHELFFVAIWEDGRLGALFPLYKKRKGPFVTIAFVGDPVSDRMDFLLTSGREETYLTAFIRWLFRQKGWHELWLENFSALTRHAEVLTHILSVERVAHSCFRSGLYYYIPIKKFASFEDYLKKNKSKKSLKHLRNYRNRLLKGPGTGWIIQKELGENTLDQMISIDTEYSYRGLRKKSFFSSELNEAFFRELTRRMQGSETFEVVIYKDDGGIRAYEINFLYDKRLLSYQAAYDMRLSRISPGTVTCLETIRRAFENGFSEYDFLLGEEAYKNQWTKDYRESVSLRIYRKTVASRLLCFLNHKKQRLKNVLKTKALSLCPSQANVFISNQTNEFKVEIINSLPRPAKVADAWNKIFVSSRFCEPFIHPHWIMSWAEAFRAENSLRIVSFREGPDIVGIVPLVKKIRFPFRILSFAGQPVSDRMDFVLGASRRAEVIDSFCRFLKRWKSWDILTIGNLCGENDTHSCLENACRSHGLKFIEIHNSEVWYFINLDSFDDFNAYLANRFNRKHRNYFRRLRRKAMEMPGAVWEVIHHVDKKLLEEMVQLDTEGSIRGKMGKCFFMDVRKQRFMELLFNDPFFQDITRVMTFRSDLGLHAYLLIFLIGGRFLAYQTAYDENLGSMSIGTQLFLESIRYAFESDCKEYDFLLGDETFKARFTDSYRQMKKIYVFPNTMRGGISFFSVKTGVPVAKSIQSHLLRLFTTLLRRWNSPG